MKRKAPGVLVLAALGLGVTWFAGAGGMASGKKRVPDPAPLESAMSPEVPLEASSLFAEYQDSEWLEGWCQSVSRELKSLKWKIDPCAGARWQKGGVSVNGRPLVYAVFGNPRATNTSLIISAVHGDELTPLYLAIRLANWLKDNEARLKEVRVVLAPLVNPDGFFAKPRTRVNSRGVDVNRNLTTRDWSARAIAAWKKRFKSDPRRNPGTSPGSEPETVFQEALVRRVRPQKILSIHAPLNYLDYDGPTAMSLARFPREYVRECLKLRSRLKAVSGGFFPGSLGNFAGQELGIPTLTLELPSGDPAKAERYWQLFNQGIQVMIEFAVPSAAGVNLFNSPPSQLKTSSALESR